jgi:hypothetical protein
MKKIFLTIIIGFLLLTTACRSNSPSKYHIISDNKVDGYDIYRYEHNEFFCRRQYEDIYYSGKEYNYGFSYQACGYDMTFFIKYEDEFIYLHDAIDQGMITLDSLIPELEELERHPEEISSCKADYFWLDFHISNKVVYAYAGGECDHHSEEIFIIDGHTYFYEASGCLKSHILFMQIEGEYVPLATLLENNLIEGKYLIPLLEEKTEEQK